MKVRQRVLAANLALLLLLPALVWAQCPRGDLDGNCKIDGADLQILCRQWLSPPDSIADIDGDDQVDLHDFGLIAADWRAQGMPLFINELLASNTQIIQDPQGENDDWIELYNASDEPINIAGMYLTDDLSTPQKWRSSDTGATAHHHRGPRLSVDLGRWRPR